MKIETKEAQYTRLTQEMELDQQLRWKLKKRYAPFFRKYDPATYEEFEQDVINRILERLTRDDQWEHEPRQLGYFGYYLLKFRPIDVLKGMGLVAKSVKCKHCQHLAHATQECTQEFLEYAKVKARLAEGGFPYFDDEPEIIPNPLFMERVELKHGCEGFKWIGDAKSEVLEGRISSDKGAESILGSIKEIARRHTLKDIFYEASLIVEDEIYDLENTPGNLRKLKVFRKCAKMFRILDRLMNSSNPRKLPELRKEMEVELGVTQGTLTVDLRRLASVIDQVLAFEGSKRSDLYA